MERQQYEIMVGNYIEIVELNQMEYEYVAAYLEKKVSCDMILKTKANNTINISKISYIELLEYNTFKLKIDRMTEYIVNAMCSLRFMQRLIKEKNKIIYEDGYCTEDIDILENLLLQHRIKYEIINNVIEMDFF